MVAAAPPRRPLRLPPETATTQRRLDRLATLLDSQFRVPGTGIRFGYDAIAGLLPGIGDTVGAALSAWIIYEAWRIGTPRGLILRMAANAGFDYVIGSVPLAPSSVLWPLATRAWLAMATNDAHCGAPALVPPTTCQPT